MENLPEISFHVQDFIAALIFLLTGGGLTTIVAKQKGWITFGKPVERRHCPQAVRKVCAEHVGLVEDMNELKTGQGEVKKILNGLESKVDKLIGYHQGKNGVDLG